MTNVAIIGSGKLAQAIRRALEHRDVQATLHSRATGFDVLDSSQGAQIGKADVVVEATGITTQNAEQAKDFFTRSTRNVNAAMKQAGASKHILVSIVGCSRPELRGNGYYAGKAEQERVALSEHENLTLVRTTQWHEFARQMLSQMKVGPVSLIPTMTLQPVALDSVADVIAQCAVGERTEAQLELAGPEITTLWQMVRQLPHRGSLPIPLHVPGEVGRSFRGGSLLPESDALLLGPTFGDWLGAQGSR